MGNLQQHARPVAGRFVGPGGPAVHQVEQNTVAVLDNPVLASSGYVYDRSHAAGVVLVRGIVKAMCFGWPLRHLSSFQISVVRQTLLIFCAFRTVWKHILYSYLRN